VVPGLQRTLLLVVAMTNSGLTVLFEKSEAKILKGRELIAKAPRCGRLYLFTICAPASVSNIAVNNIEEKDWNRALGQLSGRKLKELVKRNILKSTPVFPDVFECESCAGGKSKRKVFARVNEALREKGIIVSDLCGPIEPESLGVLDMRW
jgi:hypothetical protein